MNKLLEKQNYVDDYENVRDTLEVLVDDLKDEDIKKYVQDTLIEFLSMHEPDYDTFNQELLEEEEKYEKDMQASYDNERLNYGY